MMHSMKRGLRHALWIGSLAVLLSGGGAQADCLDELKFTATDALAHDALGSDVAIGDDIVVGIGDVRGSGVAATRTGSTWTQLGTTGILDPVDFVAVLDDAYVNARVDIGISLFHVLHVRQPDGTFESHPGPPRPEAFLLALAGRGDTIAAGGLNTAGGSRVHVSIRVGTGWTRQATLTPDTGGTRIRSLAIDDDRLIVGSETRPVEIYARTGTTWALEATVNPPVGSNSEVAIDGDIAAVRNSEGLFLFRRTAGTWSLLQEFRTNAYDEGGVTFDGGILVVGRPGEDANRGAVDVYEAGTAGLFVLAQRVTASDGDAGDRFGLSVAVHANGTIAIGAPGDDDESLDAGALYLVTLFEDEAPLVGEIESLTLETSEVDATTVSATVSDEDALTCTWSLDGVALGDAAAPVDGACSLDLSTIPDADLTIGTHTISLDVSDGCETTTIDVVLTIADTPPVPAAGGDACVVLGATVTLTGSVADYDGGEISYAWRVEGSLTDLGSGTVTAPAGGDPVAIPDLDVVSDHAELGVGLHVIVLAVDDGANDEVVATIEVEIKDEDDTTPPTLNCEVDPRVLRPSDGTLQRVVIKTNATDDSGVAPSLDVSVRVRARSRWGFFGRWVCRWYARTHTMVEVVEIDDATGEITLDLRAGKWGCGWLYKITVTATDADENASSCRVKVKAPSRRRRAAH